MKKFLFFLFCLVCLLTACNTDTSSSPATSSNDSTDDPNTAVADFRITEGDKATTMIMEDIKTIITDVWNAYCECETILISKTDSIDFANAFTPTLNEDDWFMPESEHPKTFSDAVIVPNPNVIRDITESNFHADRKEEYKQFLCDFAHIVVSAIYDKADSSLICSGVPMFSGLPSFVFQVKLEHGVIKEAPHSFIDGEQFCISLTSLTSDVPRFYFVNTNGDSTAFFTELVQAVK